MIVPHGRYDVEPPRNGVEAVELQINRKYAYERSARVEVLAICHLPSQMESDRKARVICSRASKPDPPLKVLLVLINTRGEGQYYCLFCDQYIARKFKIIF